MGLIFNIPQKNIELDDPRKAVKQVWKYITAMQEQLEHTLLNLDSDNITEISTNITKITNGQGGTVLSGEYIDLRKGNYRFRAGTDGETFRFDLTNSGGNTVFAMSGGNLVISRHADITIDGGEW